MIRRKTTSPSRRATTRTTRVCKGKGNDQNHTAHKGQGNDQNFSVDAEGYANGVAFSPLEGNWRRIDSECQCRITGESVSKSYDPMMIPPSILEISLMRLAFLTVRSLWAQQMLCFSCWMAPFVLASSAVPSLIGPTVRLALV